MRSGWALGVVCKVFGLSALGGVVAATPLRHALRAAVSSACSTVVETLHMRPPYSINAFLKPARGTPAAFAGFVHCSGYSFS